MKKIIILIIAILLLSLASFSQSPNWAWAKSFGGNGWEMSNSVATDPWGNVYVTGYFNSPTIYIGTYTLFNINADSSDIFLVKYDPNGNVLWAKSFGGTGHDSPFSVTTDISGNVYVAGSFWSSTIIFGSDTLINASNGVGNIFIVKCDSSGNPIWATNPGGTSNNFVWCLATDLLENVYVIGDFQSDSITFGTTTLINADTINNSGDIFLTKYDSSGHVIWAKRAGGPKDDGGIKVTIDATGFVYIMGGFSSDSIIFGALTLMNTGSGSDIFITKYDSNGNVIWAKSFGGSSDDAAFALTTDFNKNVLIAGYFYSPTLILDSITLTHFGGNLISNAFLAKFDSTGNVLWAKRAGGPQNDHSESLITDTYGNVYLGGDFNSSTIVFGSITLQNVGSIDMFFVKYDSSGNVIWAKDLGGNDDDYSTYLTRDILGNIYMIGAYSSSSIAFGATTLTGGTYYNPKLFLAKLIDDTGIEEILALEGLSVYPNPASNTLTLHRSTTAPSATKELFTIADVFGRIVYSQTLNLSTNTTIDISSISNSIYCWQLLSNQGISATGKLVIMK